MSKVNITGLNPGKVLAALYNAARPQGMGYLHYNPAPMTKEDAEELLSGVSKFDYLRGRVIKIEFNSPDEFDARLYDRDNGDGCAQVVIDSLRQTSDVWNDIIRDIHRGGTIDAALNALRLAKTTTRFSKDIDGKTATVELGADDLGSQLEEKVHEAIGSVLDEEKKRASHD